MDSGKLVSFWSASGSPGKTSLATAVAAELVSKGKTVLLIDADTYAPSIDVLLALNDHPAGLAAACRLVSQKRFDLDQLNRLSVQLEVNGGRLTIMTGVSSSDRWPEISEEKFSELVAIAKQSFNFVLLDLASNIETAPLGQGVMANRNGVTRWSLKNSNQVVAICGADPVSIARHLDAISALSDLKITGELLTVVNRLRASVLGSSAKQQISETLFRLGQVQVSGFIPDDSMAADSALKASIPITLGKRSSQARQAIALFSKTKILGDLNRLDAAIQKKWVAKLS